jgi:hypothetical protein
MNSLWKSAMRRIVEWREALDHERERMGCHVLVILDCGHGSWMHPSALYIATRPRKKLHCVVCEEATRAQHELFKPTRWRA